VVGFPVPVSRGTILLPRTQRPLTQIQRIYPKLFANFSEVNGPPKWHYFSIPFGANIASNNIIATGLFIAIYLNEFCLIRPEIGL